VSWLGTHRYLIARRTTQLSVIVLFWLGAWHGLGVLTGNLSSSHVLGTVPLSDPFALLQIMATGHLPAATALLGGGIVLLFYFVVGGRSFCSWVCPVNPLSDFARFLKRRLCIGRQFRVARRTRAYILLLALPVSAITGTAAFEWLSPVAVVHRELIFGASLGLLVVPAILLLDLFVVRLGWCGSLCPLGAFYSLVGQRSLLRMGFRADRCDRCGDCAVVCPEKHVIDYDRMAASGFVDSGDCSNCARCLEVCPRDAYHFTLRLHRDAARQLTKGDHRATQCTA
jgi:ferredoxin-type protein NapH